MNSSDQDSVRPNPWVSCSKPDLQAKLRLFCFPFAGAGSSIFNSWSAMLLPEIELHLIHLPGRDRRIQEPQYLQLQSLVEALAIDLHAYLDKPFAFFGHSMGALISFEVARQLRRSHAPQPDHLFVSARAAPQSRDPYRDLYVLGESDFLAKTEELYGAMPEVVRQDPEVLKLFLTMMRADLKMLQTYQYTDEVPFNFPITVFGGMQDKSVTRQDLETWQYQTSAGFKLIMFPGEHLYIQSARSSLLQALNKEFAQLPGIRGLKGLQPDGN